MKNLILLPLVAVLFLSSCSSKLGIAKRKYTKGYYVSVTKGLSSDKKSTKKRDVVSSTKQKLGESELKNEVFVPSVSVRESKSPNTFLAAPVFAKTNATVPLQTRAKTSISASVVKHMDVIKASFKPLTDLKNSKVASDKSGASADTNTILLVILCLFWWLNLIAVYLHQGKKITNDFWITLILDLTIVLGIVYSILVVLDLLTFA